MPPQQPALSNSSSTNSLSSWPVIKYSYSASSISTSIQPPWAHFTHRDNVFLVIDTQRIRGYIQDDGKFSDHQTRLKIVWGVETLESLDLTSLAQQITPPRDLQQPNKSAFIALGRSPSLAIKYFKAEDQTIRRFQIKLVSDAAYHAAAALLEQAKCPIGIPSISRDETRYDTPSRGQMQPLFPHFNNFNNAQVQHIPPGTSSGYSNTSSSSGAALGEPHSSNNSFSNLDNVSPMQIHDLAVSATSIKTIASRDFREPSRAPQTPSYSNISYSYLPGTMVSSGNFLEDIPPPRPPNFGPRKLLDSPSTYGNKLNAIASLSDLPPLPKPTPLKGPPPSMREPSMASPPDGEVSKYRGPNFSSSGSADTFYQGDPLPAPKKRAGAYRPGLPGIVEEHTKGNSSNDRDSFPVFPRGYKKPEVESCSLASANPRQKTLAAIATTNAGDTNTGGKRKQNDDGEGGQEQQKKPRIVLVQDESSRACEEEEFRQIEDFIVSAIHDDDFLKLVERIGCVWQRMGFDDVGVKFFGGGELNG